MMKPVFAWAWILVGYGGSHFAESDKNPQIPLHLWTVIGIGCIFHFSIFEEIGDSDVSVEILKSSGFLRMTNQTFGEQCWHLVRAGASCYMNTSTLDALFEI
jgi:hypothetical protein